MKISKLFLENIPYSNMRCTKTPIFRYTKSKIIKLLGLDLIEYYIYCKYWHSVHTKDEMKSSCFFCTICEDQDYFNELFSLFFLNRLHAINPITYLMKLPKWIIHFWHMYIVWIKDLSSCPVCYRRYLKSSSVQELKERRYRYSDMMKPPDPDESDL